MGGGVRVDVNREVKFLCFFCLFFFWGGGQVGGCSVGVGGGSQVGCEQRLEVFVNIQKKNFCGGGEGPGGGGLGGQGGYEELNFL